MILRHSVFKGAVADARRLVRLGVGDNESVDDEANGQRALRVNGDV